VADVGAKAGLACAISATASRDRIEELIALVSDLRQGQSRVLLLPALRRLRDPKAKLALETLAADPNLAVQIAEFAKADQRRNAAKNAKS
jgi:hypothetical protein